MFATPVVKNVDYDKVYEPAEDSFLLLDCLEQESPFLRQNYSAPCSFVVEIGSGSGIVTSFVQKNILENSIFVATDLNPHACAAVLQTAGENCSTLACVDACQMNLTTGLVRGSVDVLVFNPPYVPAESVPNVPESADDYTWLDLALLGGENGMVTTWNVLNDLHNILSPNGVAYILFCARNFPDKVAAHMESKGWDVTTVIHRKAGWEVLSVLKFTRR